MSGTTNVFNIPFNMVPATAGNMASTVTGTVDTQGSNCWSIQATWSGTPTGTLKLQTSNDIVKVGTDANPGSNVINWTDLTGSSQSLTGSAGSFVWRQGPIGDRWIQVIYTPASSTGTLLANYNGKD